LYEQCNRYRLPIELIVVDWNPPLDRPGLADVIQWPEDRRFIRTRVISVPPKFHRKLPHSEDLPLFQMIGKNVGIRRANGEYVLATNIDILFSDELMEYLSKRPLQHGHSYRVDRFDIRNDVLQEPPEKVMSFCGRHILRVNTKLGTFFNPVIGKLGKIIYPVSDAVMSISVTRIAIFVGRCARGIARIGRDLFRMCISALKSGFSYGKVLFPRLDRGIHMVYSTRVASLKCGVSYIRRGIFDIVLKIRISLSKLAASLHRCVSYIRRVISDISLKMGRLVIPKKYRSPLHHVVSDGMAHFRSSLKKLRSFFGLIISSLHTAFHKCATGVGFVFERLQAFIVSMGASIHRGLLYVWTGIKSLPGTLRTKMQAVLSRLRTRVRVPAEKKNSVILLIEFFLYRVKLNTECGFPYLHFNGCGDFALMSRADWDSLGGYLEDRVFSWNADSLFLIDAYYCGIPEIYLLPPKIIRHVEHSAGSGWTPGKGEQLLFERLEKSGIPYITWDDCLDYARQWREVKDKPAFLHKIKRMDYGFLEWDLPERCIE